MFDYAMDRAKFLDNYLQMEGKLLGPLHGLPISVKVRFYYLKLQIGLTGTFRIASISRVFLPLSDTFHFTRDLHQRKIRRLSTYYLTWALLFL